MTQTADFYLPGGSWLYRSDPRLKFVFAAAAMVLLVLLRSLETMLAASVLMALLHRSAGVAWRKVWEVARALLPVSALMLLLRVVFYPQGLVLAKIGPLSVTTGGLALGGAFGLRLLAMGLAVFAVLYTTPGEVLVAGMHRLGLPYGWALTIGLALRFIPTVRLGHESIARAQRARGLDLEGLRGLARVRAQLPILLPLIISSFRASEQLARALEARAFNAPGVRRTAWIELHFRAKDGVLLAALMLVTAVVLYCHLRFGFGAGPV